MKKNKINKSSRKRFVRSTDLLNKFLVFFLLINISVIYLPHIICSAIFTLVQMKLKNLIKICQTISEMDVSTLIEFVIYSSYLISISANNCSTGSILLSMTPSIEYRSATAIESTKYNIIYLQQLRKNK